MGRQADNGNEDFWRYIDGLKTILKRSSSDEVDELIKMIVAESPDQTEEGLRDFFSKVYTG